MGGVQNRTEQDPGMGDGDGREMRKKKQWIVCYVMLRVMVTAMSNEIWL